MATIISKLASKVQVLTLKTDLAKRRTWVTKRSISNYKHQEIDDRYNNNTRKHTFPSPTPQYSKVHTKTAEIKTRQQHQSRQAESS